jgi:hypothetical protein
MGLKPIRSDCMKISVVKNILEANERIAQENRAIFDEKNLA